MMREAQNNREQTMPNHLRRSPSTDINSHNTFLLTVIMSNERPFDLTDIRRITGSFKGKLSSLLHLSRAPTPSSIDKDPISDNSTK